MVNAQCAALASAGFDVDPLFTEELVAAVADLIERGEANGEKTGIWEEICDIAQRGKLAWYEHVQCDHMGVDEDNRSTFGVGGSESQFLGANILRVGFSWKKCADSTCLQNPPAPLDKRGRTYNQSLVDVSDSLIPNLTLMTHKSLGGGHTNTFFRQVKAKVKCVLPKDERDKYCDSDGFFSPDKMIVNRPLFKDALNKGLRFLCFHWQCRYIWQQLPDFAQGALNTSVQGDQSEVEGMLKIHMLAATTPRREDGAVDWKQVERVAVQSMPFWASWAPALCKYVAANAGGEDGALLKELALYANRLAQQNLDPPGH